MTSPASRASAACREHAARRRRAGVQDEVRRLVARAHAELRERRRQMALDGALGEEQLAGDRLVAHPGDDHAQAPASRASTASGGRAPGGPAAGTTVWPAITARTVTDSVLSSCVSKTTPSAPASSARRTPRRESSGMTATMRVLRQAAPHAAHLVVALGDAAPADHDEHVGLERAVDVDVRRCRARGWRRASRRRRARSRCGVPRARRPPASRSAERSNARRPSRAVQAHERPRSPGRAVTLVARRAETYDLQHK